MARRIHALWLLKLTVIAGCTALTSFEDYEIASPDGSTNLDAGAGGGVGGGAGGGVGGGAGGGTACGECEPETTECFDDTHRTCGNDCTWIATACAYPTPDCDADLGCVTACGNGVLEDELGEEVETPLPTHDGIPVDAQTCRWDFSSVSELYCHSGCSWAGSAGCDVADADLLCKLRAGSSTATAVSFATGAATVGGHGFGCPGNLGSEPDAIGLGTFENRGVAVDVYYFEAYPATYTGNVIKNIICSE